MSEYGYKCGLCREEFFGLAEKITHNCPEKPEERCKKKMCGREPKDDSGYCAGHKPKPYQLIEPEKEVEEREIPVWRVEINYTVEHLAKVKAPSKDEAIQKVREMPESETFADKMEIMKRAEEINTVTETEEQGYKTSPPKFRKLNQIS